MIISSFMLYALFLSLLLQVQDSSLKSSGGHKRFDPSGLGALNVFRIGLVMKEMLTLET